MTREVYVGLKASSGESISEDAFKGRVMQTAVLYGWRVCHVRPALKANGKWVTPIEGHVGLPDLILARDGAVILAELKSSTGRTTDDQRKWLAAAGTNGRLWAPADWPEVLAELSSPRSG